MNAIEEKVIPNIEDNITIYKRFVDDSFLLLKKESNIQTIINAFESNSKLRFTYELESNRNISFLDISVTREDTHLSMSVFRKSTSSGKCLDYDSFGPETYKRAVIQNFINRAIKLSSDWQSFHKETAAFTQILVNNNYPQCLIEKMILHSLKKLFSTNEEHKDFVTFYFKGQWSTSAKHEETRLRKIVHSNITTQNKESKVQLRMYYPSYKLENALKRNNSPRSDSHVVYQYSCSSNTCQSVHYIGYTTNLLSVRCRQHQYKGTIQQHWTCDHMRQHTEGHGDHRPIQRKARTTNG